MEKDRVKTLMRYSKKDLAERIAILEHNNKAINERFEIQYSNCMRIVEDMNLLNSEMKKLRKD